jgi:hypothetical protein
MDGDRGVKAGGASALVRFAAFAATGTPEHVRGTTESTRVATIFGHNGAPSAQFGCSGDGEGGGRL